MPPKQQSAGKRRVDDSGGAKAGKKAARTESQPDATAAALVARLPRAELEALVLSHVQAGHVSMSDIKALLPEAKQTAKVCALSTRLG
jgi:hypothetical protein